MNLPPLPIHRHSLNSGNFAPLFTADQLRAYAEAAVLAERERCAKLCEQAGKSAHPADLAEEIRSLDTTLAQERIK